MFDFIVWVISNIGLSIYHFAFAITHPSLWLDWTTGESLMRFIYFGGSVEFFFVFFTAFLILTAFGVWKNSILWLFVRGLEGFANGVGRIACWAGLLMVLQQILIVFLQRIFLVSEISLGPFGYIFTRDLSWYSEELKLYNALIVCLCCAYTFVQGGHVRVDLVYAVVNHRRKRVIDMCGSMILMLPAMVLTWMYSWYFMWRHLITPKVAASDGFDRAMMKARAVRWNVETIGFSPNGFDAYFLFKVLIVAFCGMMILQAIAFFWRSYLEFVEGEASANKYLDRDTLGDDPTAETAEHLVEVKSH